MKNNVFGKSVSAVIAILMVLSVLISAGLYLGTATPVFANESNAIAWTFTNGGTEPFTLVNGSPDGVSMTAPETSAIYELHSPVFTPTDGKVDFLIGGDNSESTYVALCDIAGREYMRAKGFGDADMTRVEWDLSYCNIVGKYVYVKIVDSSASERILFDDFHAIGTLDDGGAATEATDADTIRWSFESGALAPFRIEEGVFGAGIIASWNFSRNNASVPINKHGDYYLSTVETDTTTSFKESYVGTIVSPDFYITSPTVTMKVGGGSLEHHTEDELYVAVVRASDGEILARYTQPEMATHTYTGTATKDGHIFKDVTFTIPEDKYTEGEKVYIRIVDNATATWAFIAVDDIRVKGKLANTTGMQIPDTYSDVCWGFEDGTTAPFCLAEDAALNSCMITDLSYNWNAKKAGTTLTGQEIGKVGTYWLNTYFNTGPSITEENGKSTGYSGGAGSEKATGSLVSVPFVLNPENTAITMQLGGNVANTVSVYDYETGEKVGQANSAKSLWIMSKVSVVWNEGFTYEEGQILYMQIEDVTTASYGFVCVDDIRFSGGALEYGYADTVWSFENGTMLPFETEATWGGGLLSTYAGSGSVPHGKYYLNTVQNVSDAGSPYNESYVGEFVSPVFLLDPDAPVITLNINGGATDCYVAVYHADSGEELGRAAANNSWTFADCSIDLTGKFSEGEKLILKIVDNKTSKWAWLGVDNIRGRFAFPAESAFTTEKQIFQATGWDDTDFSHLIALISANEEKYTAEEYPSGKAFLDAVASMRTRQADMLRRGVYKDSSEIGEWVADMQTLAKAVSLATPVFGDGLMIFTVHHQYKEDHHNTHNMFPAYNGEISDKTKYTPGGAVKVLNLKTGEVTTLLEDADGLYRDLEVSYDSDRILLSYREDRDSTYNIVEYTLSDDRLSVVGTKQLTSLSTADGMDPLYMPSGNIVFSSTRDPKYVMCNRHISANLYRMEADGANIVKITSSTLFERPTDVLPDGRILYDRWEYNDRDFASAQGLWTVYEDGTKQDTYYGNNSPTGATIEAKAIPGTQKVIATLSSCHDLSWGAIAIIDRAKGVDGSAPVEMTWPASVKDKIGDPGKDANNIDAYKSLSVKYEDPEPLSENQFLVSRMLPGSQKMGIYLVDTYGNELLLYEDATDMSAFDARLITPRGKENVTSERRNYKDAVGTFFVQDVYQGTHMEGVERGSVATLRIVESVDKKYVDQSYLWQGEGQQNPGVNWHSFEVKRVIGEVPVYADGSAYFEVPQDAFVYFQLLDADGKMIQSMRSGTLVQSGEQTGCVGCHEDKRTAPSTATGKDTPMALKANVKTVPNPDYVEGSGLPKTVAVNTPDVPKKRVIDFESGTDTLVDWKTTDLPTMNYLTEVQPIFTKNCLTCHGYDTKEADLSLVPDKDVIFNASYMNLWVDRNKSGVMFENLVGAIGGGDSAFYNAKSWGSYNSPLVTKIFEDESHASLLTDAEKRRIAEWVDLNGTYYGDYSTNYGYNPGGRSPLTAAERTAIGDTRTLGWSTLTLATLDMGIYFDNPEKSPVLQGKTGTELAEALAIIQGGLEKLRINPDVDWSGLSAVPGNTALPINPFRQCAMDAWRTDKVALYDAMEAANRAAIANGAKLYDKDHEAAMAAHNAKWPGWPTVSATGNAYTVLPE